MTIVESVDKLTDWLNDNVCPKVTLKRPSDTEQGTFYDYEETSPVAFSMYQPGTDKLPEGVTSQVPSVLVNLIEGADTPVNSNSRLQIQLSFIVWNPGVHPDENGMTDGYRRNSDGWKDVWAFLERTLAEIENAEYLDGLRFVKEAGVKYGQFSKDGQIADTYPYYYAWATLTVERGLDRTGAAYKELL